MIRDRRFALAFAALVGFVLALGAAAPLAAAETGGQAVDSAWMKAMKANDIEAAMACYAPDAVAWFPNEAESRGEKAIRASYQGLLGANVVKDVSMSDTHYETVGARSVGWGKFSLTLAPKAGGAPLVMAGRFTEVVERRGSKWVYVVDHASAEPPPAEAKKP